MRVPAWVEKAKSAIALGSSYQDVAREVGVTGVTVSYWCGPGQRERVLERLKARNLRPEVKQAKSRYNRQRAARPGMREQKTEYMRQYAADNRVRLALRRSERKSLREGYAPCVTPPETIQAAYDGTCAICGYDERSGSLKPKLHLDHCHETGKFRGWLCIRCNNALGFVGDSPTRCDELKSYIERHAAC